MKYLITYDRNSGDNYEALYQRIKECGIAWHGMQNTWFVDSVYDAATIRDHCAIVLDRNDKLFVCRIDNAAWTGFTHEATDWLRGKAA